MNEAIELAVEKGGYQPAYPFNDLRSNQYFLDPLFWQALGKALGWTANIWETMESESEKHWLLQWHRFIDWIAEGKDVDLFFNDLLK